MGSPDTRLCQTHHNAGMTFPPIAPALRPAPEPAVGAAPTPKPTHWPAISLASARRKAELRGSVISVPSPCTGVCTMDATVGWCQGCYRTLDELAQWGRAPDATKLAIWTVLEQRQALRHTLA